MNSWRVLFDPTPTLGLDEHNPRKAPDLDALFAIAGMIGAPPAFFGLVGGWVWSEDIPCTLRAIQLRLRIAC